MNAFEKILLGIVAEAPATIPIFVHSSQGLVIANASENLLGSILAQFAPKPAPPAPAPPAA